MNYLHSMMQNTKRDESTTSQIYNHFRSTFKCLKVEHFPFYGWAVVGRKAHNSKSFALVATKCENEEAAQTALKTLKK